jgi:hypothetical protein
MADPEAALLVTPDDRLRLCRRCVRRRRLIACSCFEGSWRRLHASARRGEEAAEDQHDGAHAAYTREIARQVRWETGLARAS